MSDIGATTPPKTKTERSSAPSKSEAKNARTLQDDFWRQKHAYRNTDSGVGPGGSNNRPRAKGNRRKTKNHITRPGPTLIVSVPTASMYFAMIMHSGQLESRQMSEAKTVEQKRFRPHTGRPPRRTCAKTHRRNIRATSNRQDPEFKNGGRNMLGRDLSPVTPPTRSNHAAHTPAPPPPPQPKFDVEVGGRRWWR